MQLGNFIFPGIVFSLLGVLIGVSALMIADLTRRSLDTGARLAWLVLLLFVPGLGLLTYFLTMVSPGLAVPDEMRARAGRTLTTRRVRRALLLSGVVLGLLFAVMVTPYSIEVVRDVQ